MRSSTFKIIYTLMSSLLGGVQPPNALSNSLATAIVRWSLALLATNCRPTGKPLSVCPIGHDVAGNPEIKYVNGYLNTYTKHAKVLRQKLYEVDEIRQAWVDSKMED